MSWHLHIQWRSQDDIAMTSESDGRGPCQGDYIPLLNATLALARNIVPKHVPWNGRYHLNLAKAFSDIPIRRLHSWYE